ncbi:DUF4387 domain-containing protein [Paenibacillus lautus]|uniref:DUF4387 domain-containing protein n=1 Tax=Paenibacillus TaxID=44249 RepID=UPI0002072FD4|nr:MULTISPECIES: DUF4387 domain-containing protein [Paenibacillus]MBY0160006.1 DUF4387 domain-containing protein [Cytobacillus firmus]EGG37944.1 hypothetical protein HMPREF9412_4926 [Paenibacillus sp. HGF5]PCL90004.1 DUF4387 domain-containing protein [Paenibacillus lautus]QOT11259.1 DUF4387 domain-containing protein [Paenibacillus sp. JNUCC-32]WFB56653.1 DUF4387 domain-containing protein [Paenibacillus sp. BR1-192]
MTQLGDLAKVLRSKNSGPFEITLDVLFDSKEQYDRVKQSGIISKRTICELYQIREEQIHHLVFFDQALGFKITMSRDISSGSVGDRDVYGAQQHAPLMKLSIEHGEEG